MRSACGRVIGFALLLAGCGGATDSARESTDPAWAGLDRQSVEIEAEAINDAPRDDQYNIAAPWYEVSRIERASDDDGERYWAVLYSLTDEGREMNLDAANFCIYISDNDGEYPTESSRPYECDPGSLEPVE